MKARVIETGEIVDLRTNHMDEFFTKDGVRFIGLELDFDFDYQPDYWEKLKHQYAGMFFKSFLDKFDNTTSIEKLMDNSIKLAKVFINKLKKES